MTTNTIKRPKERPVKEKGSAGRFFHSILDGSLLSRDKVGALLPFIFFLVAIAIFFIANNYHAEKQAREVEALREEVKELRTRNTLIKAELMYLSNQSEVVRRLSDKGFVESTVPPRQVVPSEGRLEFLRRITN
ncbi:MAG TPA: FtsL-like putative cell division protein [Bacteroidales bacterium]|nr:FtsL-like putative cell division protein [Bacteroidales bacterium]